MIRSMTAFSRKEATTPQGSFSWELRSVNHRFSEVSLRLPEVLRALEPGVRAQIGARIKRGKIDLQLRFQALDNADQPLSIDQGLASKLARATREIDALLYSAAPINALTLLQWPGVLKTHDLDSDVLAATAMALFDEAIADLLASREREGEALKAILDQRCQGIDTQTAALQQQLPTALTSLRARLETRLAELDHEIDPARIAQEVVILANKADVAEELDRLRTHVAEIRRVLTQDEPVGRRLDFLIQELHREANTLGAKATNAAMTTASVELKVLIEQMREQVQNIE